MKIFYQIDHWTEKHHPVMLDLLRVLLGITIFFKGLYFISHTEELQHILANSAFPWLSFAVAHYVAIVHLAGGIMISIGLFTRKAVALQIPILLGAVFLVNVPKGFFAEGNDLAFSIVVLSLLCFYFVYGPGYRSADNSLNAQPDNYGN